MASCSTTGALFARGQPLCRRCCRIRLRVSTEQQRRWIGQKYLAKVAKAEAEWQEQAKEIEAGSRRNLWDLLEERGFVKDIAGRREDIRELMRRKRIGAYVGIDPTAPSLHVGHLVPLMPLFWMYMHGYRAVSLVGGSTAKIGDPAGRLKSRERMESSAATKNMVMIHYQLRKLWANVERQAERRGFQKSWAWRRSLLNNGAWWTTKVTFQELMRRLGAGMRIGPMLSRDTVKDKMTRGDGMSFAEFAYPLMQGWDWWHLFSTLKVQMQIGGSDQYGNIVTGIDAVKIIRDSEPDPGKALPQESVFDDPVGFTVPLLTDSSGAKFGKSAGNAIWLDPMQTSPFDFYGYFVRRPDADVENLLRLFTFLPLPDIEQTMAEHNADPARRVAQHLLAYEVLHLVHGAKVADEARAQHRALYGKNTGTSISSKSPPEDGQSQYLAEEGVPTTPNNAPRIDMVLPESLVMGKSIARILYAAGLGNSTSEANRLVLQQGAYIGGAPGQPAATNKGMSLDQIQFTPVKAWFPEDTKRFLIGGKILILRKGKHNIRVVEVVSDEEWAKLGKTYPGEPFTGEVRKIRTQIKAAQEAVAKGEPLPQSLRGGQNAPTEGDPQRIDFPERKSRQIQAFQQKLEGAIRESDGTTENA